jgi:hypothetical protein
LNALFSAAQAIFHNTPSRWAGMAQAFPLELLARVPAPGEWSALECLQHILDVEQVFHTRLLAFQGGHDFPAFFPDEQGTRPASPPSPADLAARFASLRAENLDLLDTFAPADYERRVRHAELGLVSLGELVAEIAAHDLMHTVQAERAMMQPFIAACGPWKIYFSDHVAAGS